MNLERFRFRNFLQEINFFIKVSIKNYPVF